MVLPTTGLELTTFVCRIDATDGDDDECGVMAVDEVDECCGRGWMTVVDEFGESSGPKPTPNIPFSFRPQTKILRKKRLSHDDVIILVLMRSSTPDWL